MLLKMSVKTFVLWRWCGAVIMFLNMLIRPRGRKLQYVRISVVNTSVADSYFQYTDPEPDLLLLFGSRSRLIYDINEFFQIFLEKNSS